MPNGEVREVQGLGDLDGEVEARGGGGRTRVGTTSGNRIAFGDVVLRDVTLAHFQRPATVASDGARAVGIVGYDLLQGHVVRLDFDRGVLEIHDGRSYRAAGESLPLLVRGRIPGLRATVELPGGVAVTDEFGLDLGAPYAVHFDSAFVARHRLLDDRDGLVRRTMRGVGPAPMVAYEGRTPGLRVGASAVRDVPALFDEASAEVHRDDGRIGVMGLAFLRRFNLVFDYGRARIELEPNGSLGAPFVVPPAPRAALPATGGAGSGGRTGPTKKAETR